MFFYCKQATSYDMCISDLSSDVCSSDLFLIAALLVGFVPVAWMWARRRHRVVLTQPDENAPFARTLERAPMPQGPAPDAGDRMRVVSGKSVSVRVDLGGRPLI